ncbi:MAG: hypothetical protein RRC07_05530 [Anaerolineae bacterium]|nr:hypothetical protein [Anaerolineae bacterium]
MMQRGSALIALAADAVGVVAAILWLPALTQQFSRMAFINSVFLGAFFVLFLAGIAVLKRVRPAPWLGKPLFLFLGGLLAFVLSTAVGYSVGFLDSVANMNRELLDEPSVTIYLLLTPASWFGLSLIYVLLLSTQSEPQPWRPARTGLALLAVNAMALALAAVARAFWLRIAPASPWLPFLATLVLALLLFVPPRLLYLGKPARTRPLAWLGWLSLLLFLGYVSWAAAVT